MKRWINNNSREEEYYTEEYTLLKCRVRERIRNKIKYIYMKTNLFNKEKIVLKIMSNDEKVNKLNIEYDVNDFIGYSVFIGEGLPALEGFIEINKNSLRYLIVDSKLDGWGIEDGRNVKHSIFIFGDRQNVLTNENDNFNIVKQDINEEIITVPLKNKIKNISKKLFKKNEYNLVFRNKKEEDILTSMILLKDRKKIIFKGMEEWALNIPSLNNKYSKKWYLRIYFLLNDKYKIIVEYDDSYTSNYMFVRNNKSRDYRSEEDSVFLWSSNNSEFKRSSYESYFYDESYNKECLSHCYVTDDYRVEIIVTPLDYLPNILILDQEGNEVSEDEVFNSEI